ncbi:hypothetical protein OAI21_02205, partial [Oceanospirillaceae bacterium]|nr:hypothetical protein [Oceanospirillaceae bacterium]
SLDFLRLPIIAIIGVLMYGETFDVAVIAGGALMLVANLINHWHPKKQLDEVRNWMIMSKEEKLHALAQVQLRKDNP